MISKKTKIKNSKNTERSLPFLLVSIIILAGFVVYFNSLFNNFVWDDNQLVTQNEYIRGFRYAPQMFSTDLYCFGHAPGNFYRPLQTLSYALDYHIWKLNPFGYHLTNLLLHILVAIALFFFLNALLDNLAISLMAGLLFTVHPIHTEAVAYISGRADMLVGLFSLLSLSLFIKSISKNFGAGPYIFSIILYILAVLSKELAVVIPFLYILYIQFFCEEATKKRLFFLTIPFFIIDLLYILLRIVVFNFTKTPLLEANVPLLNRLYFIPQVILEYIHLLIFPVDLHMERDILPLTPPEFIFSILAAMAMITLLLAVFKNKLNRIINVYFVLWFFIMLLPVLNIFPVNARIAEHWLYMPSIGVFTLVGVGLKNLTSKIKPIIIYAGFAALLSIYGLSTVRYNTFWHDNQILYNRTLTFSPDSARVHNNLGKEYNAMGDYEHAIAEYENAIKIKPNYAVAHNNLGVMLGKIGRGDEAIRHFNSAIEINPNFADAYKNLAMTYYQKGDLELAQDNYEKCIKLNPHLAEPYNNLGVIYVKKGLTAQARKCWEKALKIKPGYKSSLDNLERLRKMNE